MTDINGMNVAVPCPEFEASVDLFLVMGLVQVENLCGHLPTSHYTIWTDYSPIKISRYSIDATELFTDVYAANVLKKLCLGEE